MFAGREGRAGGGGEEGGGGRGGGWSDCSNYVSIINCFPSEIFLNFPFQKKPEGEGEEKKEGEGEGEVSDDREERFASLN